MNYGALASQGNNIKKEIKDYWVGKALMAYLRMLGLIVTVCSTKGKKNEIIGKGDIKVVGPISNAMGRKIILYFIFSDMGLILTFTF